jgi:hypothetical protein
LKLLEITGAMVEDVFSKVHSMFESTDPKDIEGGVDPLYRTDRS